MSLESIYKKTRLVWGVGINDSPYKVEGCPYYRRWTNMLQRCYSEKFLDKNPTYRGCRVGTSWKWFTNFKSWMKNQDWKGKSLDKDIIVPDNKVYSEETCAFISRQVNTVLIDSGKKRGEHPRGVSYCNKYKLFKSECNLKGKNKFLGYFNTPEEASATYSDYKYELLVELAKEQEDTRVKKGLLQHANLIKF